MKSLNDVTVKVCVYRLCCMLMWLFTQGMNWINSWLNVQMIWNQMYYLIVYQSEYMKLSSITHLIWYQASYV